jgi:hypothetical protein
LSDAEPHSDPFDESLGFVREQRPEAILAINLPERLGMLVAAPQVFRFGLTKACNPAIREAQRTAVYCQ